MDLPYLKVYESASLSTLMICPVQVYLKWSQNCQVQVYSMDLLLCKLPGMPVYLDDLSSASLPKIV